MFSLWSRVSVNNIPGCITPVLFPAQVTPSGCNSASVHQMARLGACRRKGLLMPFVCVCMRVFVLKLEAEKNGNI